MRRAFIILNPEAGRGRGRGLEGRLAYAASRAGWECVVRVTRRAGEEVALAREAATDGWPVVVAAGGDGTVHGVANGLLAHGPTNVILGHIPVGSGNDYARVLGFRRARVEDNLARMFAGTEKRFDVGRVGDEYFVNGMGVGFDAEVVRQTLGMSHLSGFPLYLTAVLRTFGAFVPPELDVWSAAHAERGRLMMLAVSIGVTTGGGFRLTPEAVPDDGLFDVCLVRRVGLIRFLRYLPSVARGTHGGIAEVSMFRSDRVTVAGLSGPLTVHLDGELRYPETDSIEITAHERCLGVLCA